MTYIPENGVWPSSTRTPDTNAVPCNIYTDDDIFVVINIDSWSWHEHGVFATGRWGQQFGGGDEIDVLIPMSSIRYIQLYYDKLVEYNEHNARVAQQAA